VRPLATRELRVVFDLLADASRVRDHSVLVQRLLVGLPHLIRADSVSYDETNVADRRVTSVRAPAVMLRDADRIFAQYLVEHPCLLHYGRTGTYDALKISDFLSRPEFHRLGLYTEYYGRIGVEYQLTAALAITGQTCASIALNRRSSDFTEHERSLLSLVRPHLAAIHAHLVVASQLRVELELLTRGLDRIGHSFIVLNREGRIECATGVARGWLSRYFRGSAKPDELPEPLAAWLRATGVPPDATAQAAKPLVIEADGGRLRIRVISIDDKELLVMSEEVHGLAETQFETLGLTRREAQVLRHLTEGKPNAAIAGLLGLSVKTVQHHLERIYQKLGVESRTAAAAWALRAANN
jgi:DNA-binding CsgD family transcriptional regulator